MTEEETLDALKYKIVRGILNTYYYNAANELHRDDDMPAVVGHDGGAEWFRDGVRHRDVGPAIIWPDGHEEFWHYGCFRGRTV